MPCNRNQAKGKCAPKKFCSETSSTECGDYNRDGEYTYEESCPSRCCYKLKPGYDPMDLCCKYKDAVVRINAEFNFTTSTDPTDAPLDDLVYGANLSTVYTSGNGFFATRHVIVCPASIVLAPPDHTLAYNRWPFTVDQIDPANIQSQVMTRAGRITVDVSNVNGAKYGYTYDADLVGVSGIGDIAVLVLDYSNGVNRNLPRIKKCHPYFRFGCSRKYRCGADVYAIGDAFARSGYRVNDQSVLSQSNGRVFVSGTIADHRYLDHTGQAQQELLAVNMPIFARNVGLPLIDRYGCVIGMQTMNIASVDLATNGVDSLGNNAALFQQAVGDGLVAGPSQFFMTRVIMSILCPNRGETRDYITAINDPAGDFVRYSPGYLGLAWEVFTGRDYMSFRDPATGEIRARFLAGTTVGAFDPAPVDVREVVGLRVAGLTGDTATDRLRGDIYLPGADAAGSDAANPWVTSPLIASGVTLNDVVVFADRLRLGNMQRQIPISLVTFRRRVGDVVSIVYRTYSSGYEELRNNEVSLVACPPFFDYPLYKYQSFPYGQLPLYGPLLNHAAVVSPNADANRPASGPYADTPVVTIATI